MSGLLTVTGVYGKKKNYFVKIKRFGTFAKIIYQKECFYEKVISAFIVNSLVIVYDCVYDDCGHYKRQCSF
ncbi:MAG: hypothetical protein PUG48_00560 [Clostridia bacterium]|nr:hypothetical protein [Clostridia bacterium]